MKKIKMKKQLAKKICAWCAVAVLVANTTSLAVFAETSEENVAVAETVVEAEVTESTEVVVETTESTEVTENTENSENTERTESSEGTENTESTESTESSETPGEGGSSGGEGGFPGGEGGFPGGEGGFPGGEGGFPGGGQGAPGGQDNGTLMEDRITDIVINVGKNESEVSITWYTNGDASAKLQITNAKNVTGDVFPTDTAKYTEYAANTVKTIYEDYYSNSVILSGLTSATTYAYRVSGMDTEGNVIWSDIYQYSTENIANGFGFLVAGDPQIGSGNVTTDTEGWVNTMTSAVSKFSDVSFLLSVGDQVNSASGNSLANEYQGFLTKNALLASIPFAPTVGNHDSNTITSYVTHNTLPNVSSYGSSDDSVTGDEDYSFRYGNTIFMMLNTNNSSIAEHKAFIEETLSNNQDATWRVVAFHQSIYSVARHVNDGNIADLRTGLSPVFVENDIDIVLMGHDHVYARSYIMGGETGMVAEVEKDEQGNALTEISNPDGVQYVTFNSASGSKYYGITNELFEYTAVQSQEKTPNYSYAFVDEGSFTITTYRSSDNTVVDTVTIKKEAETNATGTGVTGASGSVEADITLSNGKAGNWITSESNANISVAGSKSDVPDGAVFNCKALVSGSEYLRVANAVKTAKRNANFVAFDMTLTTAAGVQISQFADTVDVSMPVPAGLSVENGKTIVVYYVENDGTLSRCETAVKDGFVTFATNHFSTYVYVEEAATSPKTGDELNAFYIGIMSAIVLGGLLMYGHKKNYFG